MGIGAKPNQVITQPEKFAEHDPDHLGSLGHPDAGQLFHRHHVGQVIGSPGQVVHPIGVGNKLVPGLPLTDLFNRPVMVTDVYVQIGDFFAVQGDDIAYQPVRADVMGTHVKDHGMLPVGPLDIQLTVQGLMLAGVSGGIGRHLGGPAREALAQRVSLPVVGHQQPPQIRMAFEPQSEHVVNFTFVPGCRGPDVGDTVNLRSLAALQGRFDPQPLGRFERQQAVNHRKVRIFCAVAAGRFVYGRKIVQALIAGRGFVLKKA